MKETKIYISITSPLFKGPNGEDTRYARLSIDQDLLDIILDPQNRINFILQELRPHIEGIFDHKEKE